METAQAWARAIGSPVMKASRWLAQTQFIAATTANGMERYRNAQKVGWRIDCRADYLNDEICLMMRYSFKLAGLLHRGNIATSENVYNFKYIPVLTFKSCELVVTQE